MEKSLEVKKNGYLGTNGLNFSELFADDLNGITPSFERIKIPSGGGVAYEVPGDNPDSPDMEKEFAGVIIYHHPINTYYKDKFDGGSNRPDCGSMDGKRGVETDSGEVKDCSKCELLKFGSAEDGKGKACKQKRRIYVLRAGEQIPLILTLPSGSLTEFSKYIMRLLNKGKKTNQVVTKFSLKKAQNATGINYSQAMFAVARELTSEENIAMDSMTKSIKALSGKIEVEEQE